MTTPSPEAANDNHGRVARIVSLSLVSLYALVALGWAASATAPNAEPASAPVPAVATAR